MEVMQYSKEEVVGNGLNGNGEIGREDSLNQKVAAELNGSRDEEEHKSSVYLDEDGGMWRCRECIWTYQIGNPCMDHHHHSQGKPFHFGNGEASKTADIVSSAEIGNVSELHSLVSAARSSARDAGNSSGAIEEEVIELEFFERAKEKLVQKTHNAYCPHCRNPISKVILRIKHETTTSVIDPDNNKFDLLGCLACFRIFLPNKTTITDESNRQELDTTASQGKCFDLRWFFGGTSSLPSDQGTKGDNSSSSHDDSNGTQSAPTPLLQGTRAPPPEMNDNAAKLDVKHEPLYFGKPSRSTVESIFDLEGGLSGGVVGGALMEGMDNKVQNQGGDVHIPIDERPNKARASTSTQVPLGPPLECEETVPKSAEVVKSIVYGGLMESITSLSVVSSAAASGAATLNIMTIGVANLIGGLFVIAHNLIDLKTNRPEDEYKKTLGQRSHFLLHAIVALLSYLIFGLVPPALYGFTFRQTDDPDMKLLAVAMASFACIVLLAIGKAYTCGATTFKEYFFTILQYATAAAMASGVAYAVGDLFEKLMDELGWFDSTPTEALLLPNINSPNLNWASY